MALLAAFLFSVSFSGNAAIESYLRLDNISGDSTRQLWTSHTTVIGFNHEVSVVRSSDGLPTGKRNHAPFKILKRISGNSPEFIDRMVLNRNIPKAELKLIATNVNGEEYVSYTYSFTNVKIISVRNWKPIGTTETGGFFETPELEEVAFTYETIEWKATPSNKVASDNVAGR